MNFIQRQDAEFLRVIESMKDMGYGAMMQLISEKWRQQDPNGALTVGACYLTVKNEQDYTEEKCKKDTQDHIKQVQQFMTASASKILQRSVVHDKSKLESPELETFTEYTPKLKHSTYGSDEYKEFLKGMKVALDHHYTNNNHHPEHYENGIDGMDLFDLIEMICDWKAAVMRHDDGDINRSLEINKDRFKMSPQLYSILKNTIDRF